VTYISIPQLRKRKTLFAYTEIKKTSKLPQHNTPASDNTNSPIRKLSDYHKPRSFNFVFPRIRTGKYAETDEDVISRVFTLFSF
jgi:hypothetical protein